MSMQTRIRYAKQLDGTMQSKEFFYTTNFGPCRVRLNFDARKFQIVRCENQEIVDTGNSKDIPQLKKAAKDALKDLGVIFATESRNITDKLESVGIHYDTDKRNA